MSLGRDGVAGLICLGLSLVLLYLSVGLPQMPLVPVGPAFYPRLVLVGMAALSAILVIQDWRARRRRTPAGAGETPRTVPASRRLVPLTFAMFGGYVLLLPLVGYRIATALFVAVVQAVLDPPRTARQSVILAAIAIGTSAVTYLVFEAYLTVLLPRGVWTDW